jgi:hypothetical protein
LALENALPRETAMCIGKFCNRDVVSVTPDSTVAEAAD